MGHLRPGAGHYKRTLMKLSLGHSMNPQICPTTAHKFKIGDRVEIHCRTYSSFPVESTVTGFDSNMFGNPLIVVKSGTNETVFYPHELKLIP